LSVVHKAAEALLVYLHWGLGFQEPWQLGQVQENKACEQQEFGGLISYIGFRRCSSVALLLARESKACGQWEFWGPTSSTGCRVHSPLVLLPAQENKPFKQWEI
jgi:hypothetical protein